MRCARCGGSMVLEEFEDFVLGSTGDGFFGRRCIKCVAIVDPVVAIHQRLTSVASSSFHLGNAAYLDSKARPAEVDTRHGDAMKPGGHVRDTETGGAATVNGASR